MLGLFSSPLPLVDQTDVLIHSCQQTDMIEPFTHSTSLTCLISSIRDNFYLQLLLQAPINFVSNLIQPPEVERALVYYSSIQSSSKRPWSRCRCHSVIAICRQLFTPYQTHSCRSICDLKTL